MSSTEPAPQAQQQGEPSIEEILASIRRIISDEGEEGAKPEDGSAPAADAASEAGDAGEEDVLDLTDRVEEPVPAADPLPAIMEPESLHAARAPDPEPQPETDFAPAAAAFAAAAAPVLTRPVVTREDEPMTLVSDDTAATATSIFSKLASTQGDAMGRLPVGVNSLDDIVKELLRPMLREWLDANLPPLVERLVERELQKIARRAEGE
jgi:cell pole-organizing protein PopZ